MKTKEKSKERKKINSKNVRTSKQLALVKKQYDKMVKEWMLSKY